MGLWALNFGLVFTVTPNNLPVQDSVGAPKAHKHKHLYGDIPTLLGSIIRGFIWDIPILVFAYVLRLMDEILHYPL